MTRCLLPLICLLLAGCNKTKSEMEALCNTPSTSPRLPGEASEAYFVRAAGAAAQKLTDKEAISTFRTLGSLAPDQRPGFLRESAAEVKLDGCALADLWEWEVLLGESRPTPAHGVRMIVQGRYSTSESAIESARTARERLEKAGFASARVVTGMCTVPVWACAVVESPDADKVEEMKKALEAGDPKLTVYGVDP
ncbi:MAG: hypothetical protein ACYC8T_25350, partial [Myxococcaceae bacterium]